MTGASDPGFIASITTVHLLLLTTLAALVVLVMVIAARRRRRNGKAAELAERRREEAEAELAAVDTAPDDPVEDAPAPPAGEPARPEPVTAPPPPPLADAMPVAPPPPAAAVPARSGVAPLDQPDADDLTQMKGVGPKLADRLGELGVTRFAQIAALSAADAAALDAQLGTFQGRMARDRWIEQAGYLARGDRAGYEAVFGKL